jgi:hypothetical protein
MNATLLSQPAHLRDGFIENTRLRLAMRTPRAPGAPGYSVYSQRAQCRGMVRGELAASKAISPNATGFVGVSTKSFK